MLSILVIVAGCALLWILLLIRIDPQRGAETTAGRVFYKVDPRTGSKTPVFDTTKLRRVLAAHLGREPGDAGVPFLHFSWNEKEASVRFRLEDQDLVCRLDSYIVSAVPPALLEEEKLRAPKFVEKGYWAEDPDIFEAPSPDERRLLGTKGFYVGLGLAYAIFLLLFLWRIAQAVLGAGMETRPTKEAGSA